MIDYMQQYGGRGEKPVPQEKKDRLRGAFQARMFAAIMRTKPELLGVVDKEQVFTYPPELKGMPLVHQDQATLKLFEPHLSTELMYEWKSAGKPDMVDFLRDQGFAL